MPFVSTDQNAWAHTPEGTKALGGPDKVKEWESSTDFSHLPKKVSKEKKPEAPKKLFRHTTRPR